MLAISPCRMNTVELMAFLSTPRMSNMMLLTSASDVMGFSAPSHHSFLVTVVRVMRRWILPTLPSATNSSVTSAADGGFSPLDRRMNARSGSGWSMVPVSPN